jgi:hypothetical protein
MGAISFYTGTNASGNLVETIEDTSGQSFRPVNNDGINSAKLYTVSAGCTIQLYNSPDGNTNEDFCIINVKRVAPEYVVNNFTRSYEDEYVRVTVIRNSGTGKIARIKIE